jgi:SMI1 / KNR4 family (SUKH-1)
MTAFDWKAFLTQWSRDLLQDDEIAHDLPADVVASGWLGYSGATEDQIAALEARLGTRLPPSYRAFLAVTNGWRNTTPFIDKLWSTDEVEWFAVRNQDWIDAYVEPMIDLPPITDAEYFVYGDEQSSVHFRTEYLQAALEISEIGDSAIYLLNPQIVTPEGEWEAWFLANWQPGATQYRSFLKMMQEEYRSWAHR